MKNYSVVQSNAICDWFLRIPYETFEEAKKAYDNTRPDIEGTVTLYYGDYEVMSKEGTRIF